MSNKSQIKYKPRLRRDDNRDWQETEIGEIPEDWEIKKIEDVFDVCAGGDLAKMHFSKHKTTEYKYPIYSNSLSDKGLYRYSDKYQYAPECITITARGDVGRAEYRNEPFNAIVRLLVLKPKKEISCYFVSNFINTFLDFQYVGSAVNQLTVPMIRGCKIALPPLPEQQQIASILSSLDDKIELNRRMNKTLEEIGKALFKRWFVDFEDKIGWMLQRLGSFFPVRTGKKNANISTENGQYPFFTCSQDILKTDNYSFDCAAIILAGNGDFNVKYYDGKFEAYQRTYVLEPYKKELLGFLYFLIQFFLNEITAGHRGSVIKFITKGMIENFEIMLPEISTLKKKIDVFTYIIRTIDANKAEIDSLSRIRNSFLPRLMSGKLRVKP